MSRKGNCLNHAFAESFFSTLKAELFYLKKSTSIEELKNEIQVYIYYYNNEGIKLHLNGISPVKYRVHYLNNNM